MKAWTVRLAAWNESFRAGKFLRIACLNFLRCDEILTKVSNLQLFETVFDLFGLEFCNFKQWSSDILERYC